MAQVINTNTMSLFPIYCEISILCVFFAVHLERFRVF